MKPPQDGKPPVRGFGGNIPADAFDALEMEAAGLMHGTVTLVIHIKDGNLTRFVTSRERSIILGKPTTGAQPNNGGVKLEL